MGVAFDFHAMATFYLAFFILIYFIWNFKNIDVKKLLFPLIIGIIIALPILFWILRDAGGKYPSEWFKIIKIAQGHHAFPSRFPLNTWLKFGIVIFMGLFFNRYNVKNKEHKIILSIYIGFIILALIGTIFTELIPVSMVVKAQLFRSVKIPILLVFIMFAGFMFNDLKQNKNYIFLYILSVLFILLNFYIALFITLLTLLIMRYIKKDLSLMITIFFTFFSFLAIKFANIFDIGVKFSFIILILVLIWFFVKKIKLKNWAMIFLIGLFLLYAFVPRYLSHLHAMDKFSEKVKLEQWVNKNTKQSDLFFVDPAFYSFRVYSKRSCYVTWGEGTRSFFSVNFALKWWNRVNSLGIFKYSD